MTEATDFRVEFDAEAGIATLWMAMAGKANKINPAFGAGFAPALDEALALPGLKGIILASGHKDFCVGADLDFVYRTRDPEALGALVGELHRTLRKLETCGKPVVAALTGSALGGGYELALACHHRVAVDSPQLQVGLPEVSLGVIPGGGGTQRLPRLIGLQPAMEVLAQGQILRAPVAKKKGLLDALAPDAEGVFAAARAWIAAHPRAQQPWDARGFVWPNGPQPETPDARNLFAAGAAMLSQKTAGAYRAPEAAVKAVYEGAQVGFDAALVVEARYFVQGVVGDQAKDMIRTFWYHRNAVARRPDLPRTDDARIRTVGILGAGMMGAGLAGLCAQRGYSVVLRDIKDDALERGMAHIKKELGKLKHLDADARAAALSRVTATTAVADLAPCDLIIEAVFEDLALKHRVIAEVEAVLGADAIFASNTSALPITDLATVSKAPERFIGMHFFSPVEKMPLLEVITAEATSDDTLARALAFGDRIKKTSIVVNDGYGFYTTRLFSAYILEAAQMVAEGDDPVLVEWAARRAGMVVSPLKVFDEVTLTLGMHALETGERYLEHKPSAAGIGLVRALVAAGRTGKAAGAGFYDYTAEPRRLWSGLAALCAPRREGTVEALADRLMAVQALEAARCMEEGILRSKADAEIGAIMGVGFAPNTGGPLAWMDRRGARAVVDLLDGLVATHGERYAPPAGLRRMAETGETWFEQV